MKPIAIGTYNFERLRRGEYIYVDKSEIMYPRVNDTLGSQFFLSRSRRFGKSLLVSMFKCLFEGKDELFKACQ